MHPLQLERYLMADNAAGMFLTLVTNPAVVIAGMVCDCFDDCFLVDGEVIV